MSRGRREGERGNKGRRRREGRIEKRGNIKKTRKGAEVGMTAQKGGKEMS